MGPFQRLGWLAFVGFALSCVTPKAVRSRDVVGSTIEPSVRLRPRASVPPVVCDGKAQLRVHFYDVGQALAVLVELPNGELVLVDAGESPSRPGCGEVCRTWHERFMSQLRSDVAGRPIAMLWVTHPHSDHMGGAADVLREFRVGAYVDNGSLRANPGVRDLVAQSLAAGVAVGVSGVEEPAKYLSLSDNLQVRGVLPAEWPVDCERKPNDCSAGLRIDYCRSSVLLVGDAELEEERHLVVQHADVLQVGHHGSDTSSSGEFVAAVSPTWAVISAGKRGEGTNGRFCHPRASTVSTLSRQLGDMRATMEAFVGESCRTERNAWASVPRSTFLLVTSQDGTVTLTTAGDSFFERTGATVPLELEHR